MVPAFPSLTLAVFGNHLGSQQAAFENPTFITHLTLPPHIPTSTTLLTLQAHLESVQRWT